VAVPTSDAKAQFVEPMLLLRSDCLPEAPNWDYELKLDGFRALAIKSNGKAHLRSRNNKSFDESYPGIVKALASLPDETVIYGEVVALDDTGRPSFSTLQNYGSSAVPVYYYIFDLLILAGQNVMSENLSTRRELLKREVLHHLNEPIREAPRLDASLPDLIKAVRDQGLEGIIAKRLDSCYEPGQRSGAWRKMRINKGREFVIGGYTLGGRSFDALIFGYYEGDQLICVARTRSGFTPALRELLLQRFRMLETSQCPFANLPEARAGRWGPGLTAEKMKDCRWLKPVLVGQFEYVEWTPDNHLRHSRFVALRADKRAGDVRREN
jgi:DNA ligase D-like protein (predicted ligase)